MAGRRSRRRLPGGSEALLFLLGAAAAFAFFSVWRPPAPPQGASAPTEAGAAGDPASVRMVDGDTFDLAGVRIRVADIDTPEVHGRCQEESRLASEATRRMAALLAEGPFDVAAIAGRDEDVYGRKLRIVSRDGRSLGDTLVAEGLAHPWVGHKLPWCG